MKVTDTNRDKQKSPQNSSSTPDVDDAAEAIASVAEDLAAELADAATVSVNDQIQSLTAERDANHEKWLRAQAEFENYKRRSQKENEEYRRYHELPLMRDVLPALDNLERAIQAGERSGNLQELLDGVKIVVRQFEDVLSRHAARPIDAAGQAFDPNLHAAIQQVPSADHPPMTVLEVAMRGYVLYDRVVRPSQVVVSAAPPPAESPSSAGQAQT